MNFITILTESFPKEGAQKPKAKVLTVPVLFPELYFYFMATGFYYKRVNVKYLIEVS